VSKEVLLFRTSASTKKDKKKLFEWLRRNDVFKSRAVCNSYAVNSK